MSTRPLPRSVARWPARATFNAPVAHSPSGGPYAIGSGPAGTPSSAKVGVRPNAASPVGPKPSTTTSRVARGNDRLAGADADAPAVRGASGGEAPCAVTRPVFTVAIDNDAHAGSVGTSVSVRCGAEQPARR